jgi:transposase-like protein
VVVVLWRLRYKLALRDLPEMFLIRDPRAIRTSLGAGVRHRDSQYLNNRLEQDHRGVKGR